MGGCASSSSCASDEKQEDDSTHYMIGFNRTPVANHNETITITTTTDSSQTMTDIAEQNGEIATTSVDFESRSMELEAFVADFPLPQRAKVTAGFWDTENENESDREFAAEEVIHILQVVCPFVNLTLIHSESEFQTRVSLGTRFISAKFRVISHREFTNSTKPRVFHGVEEMINVWPHTVKALSNHNPGSSGQQLAFGNGDRLRLIRIARMTEGEKVLECKVLRGNMQLLQLPLNYTGNFAEVDDPKGYTLLELVTIARVERTLMIHRAGPSDVRTLPSIPGIPGDFDGYILMEKPQLFVQMERVPRSDDEYVRGSCDEQQQRGAFLVPIGCPIDVSPREDTYQCHDCSQISLKELVAKYNGSTPFLARIICWDEETTVLQQNIVRPGHCLIFLKHEKTAKILARDKVRDRYYMVPVDHTGSFVRTTHIREDCGTMSLNLKALEKCSFPFDVKFTNAGNPYSNVFDCVLPTETTLTFEAYIGDDKAAIVAKFCDSVICNRFHLPLRTKLMFQFEKKWTNPLPPEDSLRWSDSDILTEEITGKIYNKLMEKYGDYEWVPAKGNPLQAVTQSPRTERQLLHSPRSGSPRGSSQEDGSSDDGYLKPTLTPPPLQPRRKNSPSRPQSCFSQGQSPSTGRRGVPPPPTVPREPPPPVPCRMPTSATSAASRHPGQPTNMSPRGKRKTEDANHRGLPPLPPPLHPPHSSTHVSNHNNDNDETTSSNDSDGQSYSYIDVETLQDSITYRQNPFPGNVATDGVSIPSDGNVSHFTADQMQLFLREVHAPVGTINAWRQLRIDGKDFAKMSNDRLQEYRIDSTVVQFFRDRSKMNILLQL